MSTVSQKISVKEKIRYSLGDLTANLVFQTLVCIFVIFPQETITTAIKLKMEYLKNCLI